MLCKADSIGVFQVESRAQIGTLPRLKPRCFYDLVTEIALIRPGPIQGGAVHPYIRRRTGEEDIDYIHPALKPVLERTLGVPLFQEQLMQIAMTVGNCTGAEADLLRRAMGSKRGVEKIERLESKLYAGMAEHGITGELADSIYARIQAFANFGFAESHAISFALWSTPRRGSNCTTRRRSSPRCCAASRWGSTRRSPSSPTPAVMASRSAARASRVRRLGGPGRH